MHSTLSSPMRLKVVYMHQLTIATSLLLHLIYVFLLHCFVLWNFMSRPYTTFMLHKSQQGRRSFPSCTNATCKRKCWYKKCLHKQPALCATARHPGTCNFTVFSTKRKETIHVVFSTPPLSNPIIWSTLTPFWRTVWCFRGKYATVTSHFEQLTNVAPSPVSRRL